MKWPIPAKPGWKISRLHRSSFLPGAREAAQSLVWQSCVSAQPNRRIRPTPRCSTSPMLLRTAQPAPGTTPVDGDTPATTVNPDKVIEPGSQMVKVKPGSIDDVNAVGNRV